MSQKKPKKKNWQTQKKKKTGKKLANRAKIKNPPEIPLFQIWLDKKFPKKRSICQKKKLANQKKKKTGKKLAKKNHEKILAKKKTGKPKKKKKLAKNWQRKISQKKKLAKLK